MPLSVSAEQSLDARSGWESGWDAAEMGPSTAPPLLAGHTVTVLPAQRAPWMI